MRAVQLIGSPTARHDSKAFCTCSECCFDSRRSIFKDDAAGRRESNAAGTHQEYLRMRLTPDNIRSSDYSPEDLSGTEPLNDHVDILRGRAGTDGHRNTTSVKSMNQVFRSWHERKVLRDEFTIELFLLFVEGCDVGIIRGIWPRVPDDLATGTAESRGKLCLCAFATLAKAADLPCLQMGCIRINQNSIDIEQYTKCRIGHEGTNFQPGHRTCRVRAIKGNRLFP